MSVTSQQTQNQTKCIMKIFYMELVRMFIIESFCGLDVSTHCFQHKPSWRMKPRIWTRCYAVDRKCIHCISHMYDVLLFNMFVKPHLAVLISRKGEITTKWAWFFFIMQASYPPTCNWLQETCEGSHKIEWMMNDGSTISKFSPSIGGGCGGGDDRELQTS